MQLDCDLGQVQSIRKSWKSSVLGGDTDPG